ncbi:MAG: hypothetical protein EOO87_08735 [Pedobacter sp.]|uniref:hypothetical protein n=1 Tax=Pedobacter namyangjuensis TaxID=600626 RepID=UPI000DE43A9E|nr:hypothetical protein [Pedobacter namyangjuensis]RZK55112.1 MAG: hypothetical protein EOO87_08735 [Pedobacter sp.]
MKQAKKLLWIAMALPMLVASCELFEPVEEEEEEQKVDNSTYSYSFTCPSGTKNTFQIPNRLSAACKKNWEYYAKTYACNEADYFAEAERRKRSCP